MRAWKNCLAVLVMGCANGRAVSSDSNDAAGDAASAPTMLDDEAGACEPIDCDTAASERTNAGCEFWPTITANSVWSIYDFAVVLSNTTCSDAHVTVDGPGGTQTVTVGSLSTQKVFLPWVPALKGVDTDTCGKVPPPPAAALVPRGAFHVTSDRPIVAYQFDALEYGPKGGPTGKDWSACPGNQICSVEHAPIGCFSYTNDAAMLMPSTSLTGHYLLTGIGDGSGQLAAITAIEDGTIVTVRLAPGASVSAGTNIPSIASGGMGQLTLAKGDVAQIFFENDPSGTSITANNPIQIIKGVEGIMLPGGSQSCCSDNMEQSELPLEAWGKNYVVTMPSKPDGKSDKRQAIVRLYGGPLATKLAYAPQKPTNCPDTLAPRQVVECGEIPQGAKHGVLSEDFEVSGDQAFMVGTFQLGGILIDGLGRGDPAQSFMVPVEQWRRTYVFLAPDDYSTSFADIVTTTGTKAKLDGALLDLSKAQPLAGTPYAILRVMLDAKGTHTLIADQPLSLQVIGYGEYTSYQYPGGLDVKAITQVN